MARAETLLTEISGREPEVVATRSVRRASARRASNRRAIARSRQLDADARIINFLAQRPGSTTGELAKGLNLDREVVSTRLTRLVNAGEINKASPGYTTEQTARLIRHQRRRRRPH